jgi:peroxiredoxin Q/BCP
MMKFILLLALCLVAFFTYRNVYANARTPNVGQLAPAFYLLDAQQQPHALQDYAGKWLVLYFYPKDDTPGCTKEACQFRDDLATLEKMGAKVVGVSVDDTGSHADFAKKYHLPFTLLADTDGKVAESYGALNDLWLIKVAKRYTFLIDPQSKIAKVYLKVDTSKHSQEIIEDLKALTIQAH